MKTLFLLLSAALCLTAGAQEELFRKYPSHTIQYHSTFRDSSGRSTGTARRSGSTVTYRDSSGRIIGTARENGSSMASSTPGCP